MVESDSDSISHCSSQGSRVPMVTKHIYRQHIIMRLWRSLKEIKLGITTVDPAAFHFVENVTRHTLMPNQTQTQSKSWEFSANPRQTGRDNRWVFFYYYYYQNGLYRNNLLFQRHKLIVLCLCSYNSTRYL